MLDNVKNVVKKLPVEKMFSDHPIIFSWATYKLVKLTFKGASWVIDSAGNALGHAIHGYPATNNYYVTKENTSVDSEESDETEETPQADE